ncbi:MAG TPA: phosphatidylserine decarboxylase [Frankiaceae bacterium]|nr:phosphatidylserine decarboxylase [Frankiaceae bacterium]
MTGLSWQAARPYVLVPGTVGTGLVLARRRRLGLPLLALTGAVAAFFRDPDRQLPTDPDLVYAAADGVVRGVDEAIEDPWLPVGPSTRISVFLSLLNVHVNRSPVAGKVTAVEEIDGGFAPAFADRSEVNYRHRVGLDGSHGPVVLVLIAGLVARRISRWIDIRDEVEAGQRISLIHFGSRTDVLLPGGSVDVLVKPGDKVRAGVTPLARYRRPVPVGANATAAGRPSADTSPDVAPPAAPPDGTLG